MMSDDDVKRMHDVAFDEVSIWMPKHRRLSILRQALPLAAMMTAVQMGFFVLFLAVSGNVNIAWLGQGYGLLICILILLLNRR